MAIGKSRPPAKAATILALVGLTMVCPDDSSGQSPSPSPGGGGLGGIIRSNPYSPNAPNAYGFNYYFGRGDGSRNLAASHWLWSATRNGDAAARASQASSTPYANSPPNAFAPRSSSSSSSSAQVRPYMRTGSIPGGTAARYFNSDPRARNSRIAGRYNNYGRHFGNLGQGR